MQNAKVLNFGKSLFLWKKLGLTVGRFPVIEYIVIARIALRCIETSAELTAVFARGQKISNGNKRVLPKSMRPMVTDILYHYPGGLWLRYYKPFIPV